MPCALRSHNLPGLVARLSWWLSASVFRRASAAARHATGRIRLRTASAPTGFPTHIHAYTHAHPRTHAPTRSLPLRAAGWRVEGATCVGFRLFQVWLFAVCSGMGSPVVCTPQAKNFPACGTEGSTGGTQRNLTNLCPAPACQRRSPRNSQFLCRVSAADQVSRLAHPLISPPFPQHNTDGLQSSAGYFRRLAVCFLPSGPSSLSSGNPAAGIASGTVDHESRQIAPFFPSTVRPGPFAAHIFSPCRLSTCPIPIPCLSVVGDAEPGLSTSSRGH